MSKVELVYLLHGLESSPASAKIQRLARLAEAKGLQARTPDYSGIADPEARIQALLDSHETTPGNSIVMGSSLGAYIAAVTSSALQPKGLFLLAPAFYMARLKEQNPKPQAATTTIIHGWNDEVVPVENSIRYAREHKAALHLVDSDHRLLDQLPLIEALFNLFLDRTCYE